MKNFDPSIALFTQDKDGVEFYEKILKGAKKHLKPNGYVLFEIGFTNGISQSAIVAEIARSYDFAMEFIEKDLSGISKFIKIITPIIKSIALKNFFQFFITIIISPFIMQTFFCFNKLIIYEQKFNVNTFL